MLIAIDASPCLRGILLGVASIAAVAARVQLSPYALDQLTGRVTHMGGLMSNKDYADLSPQVRSHAAVHEQGAGRTAPIADGRLNEQIVVPKDPLGRQQCVGRK